MVQINYGTSLPTINLASFPNEADDDAKLIAAMAAVPDNGAVKFLEGEVYQFNQAHTFNTTGRNITLEMTGAVLEFQNPNDGLILETDWSADAPCGAVSQDGLSVTLTTPADAANFRVKDIVRIVSEDNNAFSFSANARQSEDLYLESADAVTGVMTFSSTTRSHRSGFNYATSVRLCQRSGDTITLKGGDITHAPDAALPTAYASERLLILDGYTRPTVENVSCSTGMQASMEIRGCFEARINGGHAGPKLDFQHAPDSAPFVYGYDVVDSSTGTVITGRTSLRQRHAIDTHDQASFDTSPSTYGSSVNLRAVGCTTSGCTNASFATHHGAINTIYENCVALDGLEAGFGIRGEATLINCQSQNCAQDIQTFDQGNVNPARTIAKTRDHKAVGCGPSINTCLGRTIRHHNYQAIDALCDASLVTTQDDGCHTDFTGEWFIKPARRLAQHATAMFGNLVGGEITFDRLRIDINEEFFRLDGSVDHPRFMDCRGNGATIRNYSMRGNTVIVEGAAIRTFFHGASGNLPDTDQLRFDLIFRGNVGEFTTSERRNLTAVQIATSNTEAYLSSVTVIDDVSGAVIPHS